MSRALRALLWKESMEVWLVALPLPFVYTGLFYLTMDTTPATGELARTILSGPMALLMVLAFLMGFGQTRLEAGDDMWSFALHRPARWESIFAAKLVVGVMVLVVPMLVAGIAGIAWQFAAGDSRGLYWIPTVADCAAALTLHAAGLFAGSPRRRFGHGAAAFGVTSVRCQPAHRANGLAAAPRVADLLLYFNFSSASSVSCVTAYHTANPS